MGRGRTSNARIVTATLAGCAAALAGVAPATLADTPDRVEIRLRANVQQKIEGRNVVVKSTVASGEDVEVRVAGAITGRGLNQIALKPRTVALLPREPLLVRLKPRDRDAVAAVVAHLAENGMAKARVRATATDEDGNVATRSVRVVLKPKSRG